MKKPLRRTLGSLIVALALAGVALGGVVVGVAAPASADVNDFSFASFDGQYSLSRDDEGRSLLTTVETLVAVFPEIDQNRGIRRELFESYDGHPTGLEIVSVEDGEGNARPYETESDDGSLFVTIAADDYVHGEQTYVISYTQRDVTRFYADTDSDEFYWDVNGTGSSQSYGRVSATVLLQDELVPLLSGNVAATVGEDGSPGRPDDVVVDGLSFEALDVAPHETLSFAIGFEAGTFSARPDGFFDAPWPGISLLATIGAVLTTVWAGIVRRTTLRDAPGRGIIVPEYLPPKNVPLLLSALISATTAKTTPAQIIALAVAGRLRVVELPGKKEKYRLQYLSSEGADPYDLEFLHALFGKVLEPGEYRDLGKADTKAASRISKLSTKVAKDSIRDGYRRSGSSRWVGMVLVVSLVTTAAAVLFALVSLGDSYGGAWPLALIGVAMASVVTCCGLIFRTPLEAKGVELRDYLAGLKVYIELAEADRLRYLQSPQGALRTPVASDDPAQIVKLNERLLPYAMLFGLEKQWVKELGRYYDELGTQPEWYSGTAPFNALVFASALSAVTTSTSSAYTASSGGSTGGISAGGGGGGGGTSGV